MNSEVTLRLVEPAKAVTIRFTTDMLNLSSEMRRAYGEIAGLLSENNYIREGNVFALYHDEAFSPDSIDVECGVTLDNDLPPFGRASCRTVEGGLMACITHRGPYEELYGAYQALMAWALGNGYLPRPPMRDVYLNDPAQVLPAELETEIYCPVVKAPE